MPEVITKKQAFEIVNKFTEELLSIDKDGLLAIYLIGSLGGGYYRPGDSDIDTFIIKRNDSKLTQDLIDEIAHRYFENYSIPKGFGTISAYEMELAAPYIKKETDGDDFSFSTEIARLKTQGKLFYGEYDLETVSMPDKMNFISDEITMQKWLNKEFGYPMFDRLGITGTINCILSALRLFLIIRYGIFEFNKFMTIGVYLQNSPPIVDKELFEFIISFLKKESESSDVWLKRAREFGIIIRDYMNMELLGLSFEEG